METHAVIYTKGRLWVKEIVRDKEKLVIFDGYDKNGKMKHREPRVNDDIGCGNGDFITFIGSREECEGRVK